ncbi:tyrosine recombinase [Sporolactobacillus putidus]|uniref:Tyrosine recombinase XerD n=1 Tax=Sporolactobacillus putidus TaxID=492735 RepID=A0A917RZI7_9BACL|nr:tyrosine recombinase [Sporolactobacillus putidus]GGL46677.1 tyrosine recombinase XerD [Sporolactobacillus putidus]
MQEKLNEFLDGLKHERGLSVNTLVAYRRDLAQYINFLNDEAGCHLWSQVTEVDVMKYLYWLKDKGSAPATLARKAAAVRGFHRFLLRNHQTDRDPSYAMEVPKVEQKLPQILSVSAVETLLGAPDEETESGCRDRAMLELLYATGMRVSELVLLDLDDLNLSMGFVRCSTGKGSERVIPLGRQARQTMKTYITEVRKRVNGFQDEQALFLNRQGRRITRQGFWKLLKQYARQTGIGESLSPETLRHSLEAHMLENGADPESVEELMGRMDKLASQRYPRPAKQRLKDVYARFHPRA